MLPSPRINHSSNIYVDLFRKLSTCVGTGTLSNAPTVVRNRQQLPIFSSVMPMFRRRTSSCLFWRGGGGEGKGQGRVGKGGRRGEGGRSEEVMDGREREKEMITKGKTRERKGMGWTQGERRGRERGDGELIVMEDKVKGDGEGGHRRKSWR